jgi:hypothetical protein
MTQRCPIAGEQLGSQTGERLGINCNSLLRTSLGTPGPSMLHTRNGIRYNTFLLER